MHALLWGQEIIVGLQIWLSFCLESLCWQWLSEGFCGQKYHNANFK